MPLAISLQGLLRRYDQIYKLKSKPTRLVQWSELDSLAVAECLSGEAMASDPQLLPSGSSETASPLVRLAFRISYPT
jgi:hypothetical protein